MISQRSFLRLVGMGSALVAFMWTPIKRLVSSQTQASQSVIQEASLELDLEALNAEDTLIFAGRILHLDLSKRHIQVEIEGGKTAVFLTEIPLSCGKVGKFLWKLLLPEMFSSLRSSQPSNRMFSSSNTCGPILSTSMDASALSTWPNNKCMYGLKARKVSAK